MPYFGTPKQNTFNHLSWGSITSFYFSGITHFTLIPEKKKHISCHKNQPFSRIFLKTADFSEAILFAFLWFHGNYNFEKQKKRSSNVNASPAPISLLLRTRHWSERCNVLRLRCHSNGSSSGWWWFPTNSSPAGPSPSCYVYMLSPHSPLAYWCVASGPNFGEYCCFLFIRFLITFGTAFSCFKCLFQYLQSISHISIIFDLSKVRCSLWET